MATVSFENGKSAFFDTIKLKVDQYFSTRRGGRSGGWKLYFKGLIQVLTAVALYGVLVFFTPASGWVAAGLCILLGLNLAILGFNVMHEGGHQSFSSRSWLNSVAAYFLNLLGGTTYFWKVKHNVNHHTWTNIDGVDSDIDALPFMRLHSEQPLLKLHRFQHVYWVFLYGISYAAWVFYEDFLKYFSGRVALNTAVRKFEMKEHIIFWFTKVSYVFFYIVLPVMMTGWWGLAGFAIVSFITGLAISIVFQLAHVVEGTSFPSPDKSSMKIHTEWAVHQVSTTSNFGTRSWLLFWLLGGLNFQIEHHLFPKVSHIHYPRISKILREVCKAYNIQYNEYPTMFGAIQSHLVYLKRLGTIA